MKLFNFVSSFDIREFFKESSFKKSDWELKLVEFIFEEILINVYISFEHYEISTFLKVFSKSVIFIMQVIIIIVYQDIITLIKISSITLLLLVLIQFFIIQKRYNLINYSKFS